MTSMPGSDRQDIHSDVVYENESARIYTTFVALQDIDDTMGPTWIWPGISIQNKHTQNKINKIIIIK